MEGGGRRRGVGSHGGSETIFSSLCGNSQVATVDLKYSPGKLCKGLEFLEIRGKARANKLSEESAWSNLLGPINTLSSLDFIRTRCLCSVVRVLRLEF